MNPTNQPIDHGALVEFLLDVGVNVRGHVRQSLLTQSITERSAVVEECAEDTIFQIDRDVESIIAPLFEHHAARLGGVVLIAEGLGEDGGVVFPSGTREEVAAVRVIMDPIDGTRGIMYDKRSAFFLAGAAPNRGANQTLNEIEAAVMVELPTSRSYLSDVFWAVKGQGANRATHNLLTDERIPAQIAPSTSKTIIGGFAQICRFFPPAKALLAQIEDQLVDELLPEKPVGKAALFNDQYIASGGQLNELLLGHDRFIADVRGALYTKRRREGDWAGMTCHPYDLCAHLIGAEAGVVVTKADGSEIDYPMDACSPADWVAYANQDIQSEVEPVFQRLLQTHGLL